MQPGECEILLSEVLLISLIHCLVITTGFHGFKNWQKEDLSVDIGHDNQIQIILFRNSILFYFLCCDQTMAESCYFQKVEIALLDPSQLLSCFQ